MMFDEIREYPRREASIRWVIGLALAILFPLALIAVLVAPAEPGPQANVLPWYVLWIGLLLPGIAGIHILPIGKYAKITLTAIYVPLGLTGMFVFSLWYACVMYGGCL